MKKKMLNQANDFKYLGEIITSDGRYIKIRSIIFSYPFLDIVFPFLDISL